MKKTVVSTLSAALVIGAASTTFAAANPFSDVAADHWAYDSVAKLASEGVISGYTNGTYAGNSTMTRYEMAQIVAKAMSKQSNINAQQKVIIDKLAAEFADELSALGVRVTALEAKTDNVQWNGVARIEAKRVINENADDESENNALLRFEPNININDNWSIHSRIDSKSNMKSNASNNIELVRLWAEAQYNKANLKLGKIEALDPVTGGMIIDGEVSGANLTYGGENGWVASLSGGRYSATEDKGGDYGNVDVRYLSDKFNAGAAYAGFRNHKDTNNAIKIWSVGANYTFNDTWSLGAAYARGSENNLSDALKNSYNAQLSYKGADYEVPGSYGLNVGYHKLGAPSIAATWDTAVENSKGWFINGEVTLAKNVAAFAEYFSGNKLEGTENKANVFYGKVEFFF